jgi:5-methylcytosine-specific restriction protein A
MPTPLYIEIGLHYATKADDYRDGDFTAPAVREALRVQALRGVCEDCTAKLFPGNVEYDHRMPDALDGEPTLENCTVLCRACHKVKSAEDASNLARALRREANHIGARAPSRNPIPGGRDTPWKMTFARGAIRR